MKWSVGAKIATKNIIGIFLIFLISLISILSLNQIKTNIAITQHSYLIADELQELLASLQDLETGQRGFLLTNTNRFLEPYNAALIKIPVTLKHLKSLTENDMVAQQNLEILETLIATKFSQAQNSLKIMDQKEQIASLEQGKKNMDEIRIVIKRMENDQRILLEKQIQTINSTLQTSLYSSYIFGIVAMLFFGIVGLLLARNIATPLKDMTQFANKIAAGELNTIYESSPRGDEIGELSQTFTQMAKNLNALTVVAQKISSGDLTVSYLPQSDKDILGNALAQMIVNMRQFAYTNRENINLLAKTVSEIFSSISQIVSTSSQTATAVSETTSTIEEVRQTSQIANQKSKLVSDNAQIAAQISQDGKKFTQETNEKMLRIRDQMISIAECMMSLSEQTQVISSIIETVDDLAQQSNLLAVNASIESEKAGEQGKGFHIVAQEIKSLADQSKQATHKVREILTDIQKATNKAVMATEQGNKVADSGVEKSNETGELISKLSENIQQAVKASIQIATSSQQQLMGMEQAATAMENIKSASSENVEISKHLEFTAQDLKKLGDKLQEIMKDYKIDA